MHLRDLIGKGLEGGTLVEYKDNCGFSLEYGRATIKSVGINGEMFEIQTDNGESHLEQNISPDVERMGYTAHVEKRGDVYLLKSSMGWCYAAAPPGVKIEKRPDYMEVSDERFDNVIRNQIRR